MAPSLNVTLPVGVAVPEDWVTMAVTVTDWPYVEGFSEEASVVVVEVRLPHPGNLKLAIRVFQLKLPVPWKYSFVYQKVQSSTGSMAIEL